MCIVYFVCCLLVNIAPTSPVNRVNPRFSAPNYKINVYGGNLCPITEIRSAGGHKGLAGTGGSSTYTMFGCR